MILAGAHLEFRLSPLDIFQMNTEHFGSAQAEARQLQYDGAVAKALGCALAGHREHFADFIRRKRSR